MSELNTVVNATLLADDNQASVSAMLNAILEKPLTPMEANQAKTYMNRSRVRPPTTKVLKCNFSS